jgi:hypothetical protein
MENFDLSQLPPEVLAKLIELSTKDDEMGLLNQQLGYAEMLRDTAMPEGRDAGRVYVAANPLEHLGAGIQRYRGMKDVKDLREKQQGVLGDQRSGRMTMADLLRGALGKKQTTAPTTEYGPPALQNSDGWL